MAHPRADSLAAALRDQGMNTEHRRLAMGVAATVVRSAAGGLLVMSSPEATYSPVEVADLLRTLADAIYEIGIA